MHLIISMINVRPETGPFTIFRLCCEAAAKLEGVRTTVLCHSLADVKKLDAPGVRFIEYPLSQKNWLFRIFYEYVYFYFLARRLKPDFWFSLHDMSPNIGKICPQAVYCHNSTPFYRARWRDLYYSPSVFLFAMFYKYLYRINIHVNQTVIVQQDWIRREFEKMYRLDNILVAYPAQRAVPAPQNKKFVHSGKYRFVYASRPRPFKNFELIGGAAEILCDRGVRNVEFIMTIGRDENRYSRDVYNKYHNCPLVKFVGCLSREELQRYYDSSDAMIFPSKLETWGLGISEFEATGRPIFIADLPYAHETAGNYSSIITFDPEDKTDLADKIQNFCEGKLRPENHVLPECRGPSVDNFTDMLTALIRPVRQEKRTEQSGCEPHR